MFFRNMILYYFSFTNSKVENYKEVTMLAKNVIKQLEEELDIIVK